MIFLHTYLKFKILYKVPPLKIRFLNPNFYYFNLEILQFRKLIFNRLHVKKI